MHLTIMFVTTTAFAHVLSGVSALSVSRYPDLSTPALMGSDDSCLGFKSEAQACDIAQKKRGDLRARKELRPIFVKFHKVGGTTVMELINTFSGVNTHCGRSCGECHCESAAKACTGHVSRTVLQHLVQAAQNEAHAFLQGASTVVDQVIPEPERRRLFTKVDTRTSNHPQPGAVPLKWLPHQDDKTAALLFITLLRDPVERIRSKYYFQQSPNNCHEPCAAKHMSFVEWMHEMRNDSPTCCEYVSSFGIGSLATSKKVLASLFDVIGFTEEMDDMYVDLAEHFGVPRCNLPPSATCRDDSTHKQDWTPEQLSLAKSIASDDIELYAFARELVKKRREADTTVRAKAETCSNGWGFGWLMR